MYLVITEPDPIQRKFIVNTVSKEFSNCIIKPIETESKFKNSFEHLASNNPDIVIINSMIRWTDPSPNMEKPPQEILDEGFYRAGIRCIKMLNDDDRTKNIPVINYTSLDFDDIKNELNSFPTVTYLFKDFNEKKLIVTIKSKLQLS